MSPEARDYRTNMVLHVINGASNAFSDALTSSALVMTAFLSHLTTSNILIALLSPLRDAGWYLPQLFLTRWVERAPRKVTAYRSGIVLRWGSWLLLVLSAFFIRDHNVLLVAVFVCISIFSVLAGFAALPFVILTAKIIPPNRRGMVFGMRQFIGGGLGVLAGGAIGLILSERSGLPFPQNYALVFLIAAVGYAVAYASLCFVHEQPDEEITQPTPLRATLHQVWAITRGDQQFRYYITMRIALLFAGAGIPFLTVYAKRVLGVDDGFIGTLVSVTLASSLLSNVVWARLRDRRGSRRVMILGSILGLGLCAAATAMMTAPQALPIALAQAVLTGLFAISGIMSAGINLASIPLTIEFAAPDQQSLYIGLGNTILGVMILLTSLVGVIVDRLGYGALFLFCGCAFVLALERLARMREPHVGVEHH